MNLHEVIRKPLVTEKTTIAREEENVVTFAVDPRANKHEIQSAVEQLFDVKVTAVNTVLRKGKVKRFRGFKGKQGDVKKAFVTLAEGQSIDVTTGL